MEGLIRRATSARMRTSASQRSTITSIEGRWPALAPCHSSHVGAGFSSPPQNFVTLAS